jgi:hypothetical protein
MTRDFRTAGALALESRPSEPRRRRLLSSPAGICVGPEGAADMRRKRRLQMKAAGRACVSRSFFAEREIELLFTDAVESRSKCRDAVSLP